MKSGALAILSCLVLALVFAFGGLAAEPVRFATHFKSNPQFWLPAAAALDKGYWKELGLEVQWIPFDSGTTMQQAVAAAHIDTGTAGLTHLVRVASRGVPEVAVGDPGINTEFFFWVLSDSPIRKPGDLKGSRIGITRYGGEAHMFAVAVAKALGLEKQVKFVAMGGGAAEIAGLKSRVIDVSNASFLRMATLRSRGEVREILSSEDYLPRGLAAQVLFAHRDYLTRNSLAVRKTIKGFLLGAEYTLKDRAWAVEKMKSVINFSQEAAQAVYPIIQYSKTGKIDPTKIKNVINFLLEYQLIKRDEVPPAPKLYAEGLAE